MEIFCACPFPVATLAWEPAAGRRSLSVCIKATFLLAPGAPASVAPLQEPIHPDDGTGTPAPDLVPYKPRVDILFAGHAHAPGGAPTDSLIARARIGAFRKSLSINGDRAWVPSFEGLRPSVAVPFRHMPLTYDRAVRTGENLAGVDISQGAALNRPLANIAAIAEQGGETPGLGPIPFGWRALRHGLAEPALLWASRAGLALGPPPPGLDFHVFNAAPAEQQLDDLPPGADVYLENLHPEHATLAARLSLLRARLFHRPPRTDRSTEIPARLDTLWIDADRGLAIALWRAVLLDLPDDPSVGRLVVAAAADGEPLDPSDVDHMLARFAPDATYVDFSLLRPDAHPAHPSYPDLPDPIPVPPIAAPSPSASSPPSSASGSAPTNAPPPPTGRAEPLTARRQPAGEPAAPPAPEASRAPITLVPPAAPAEVSAIQALPFRPPPTGFEGMGSAPPPSAPEDDEEQTPPRGYPAPMAPPSSTTASPSTPGVVAASPSSPGLSAMVAVPPPRPSAPSVGRFGTIRPEPSPPAAAAPAAPVPGADDPYYAVKMEAWQTGRPLGEVLARHGIDEAAFRAHEAAKLDALGREGAAGGSELAVAVLDGLASAGERSLSGGR